MKLLNRMWPALGMIAAVALLSPLSHAQMDDPWYVSPMITYIDDDENRNADDEVAGAQVAVGKPLSNSTAVEFNFGAFNLHDTDTDSLTQIRSFGMDFVFHTNKTGRASPFLLAGVAIQHDDFAAAGSDTNFASSLGVGLFTWLGDDKDSALRAEARLRTQLGSPHNNDVLYSLGFLSTIGEKAPPPPADSDGDGVIDPNDRCPGTPPGTPVDSRGCELDSDGDGVADSKDACPDTPAGTKVDDRGCPLPVADSDGDGVPDDQDACPNTPRGVKVDARGCELDSDGDGVVDSRDRCPGTKAGVRVDVNGCEIRETINLPGVQFELNSDEIKSESFGVLNDAAATLNKHGDLIVEVAGHTDSSGSDSYNLSLSDRRAASVAAYLAGRGVAASRLQSRGYGETQPIADNSTAGGRAMNRRVELRILNQ